MRTFIITLLVALALMVAGCSGSSNVPTAPEQGSAPDQVAAANPDLAVLYSGVMNLETGQVEPNRESSAYYVITPYVNFWFTINGMLPPDILDITLHINNITMYTVHDVCLVFEDTFGKKVMNPDSYMDIYGPWDLDPFIAFRKESPTRQFPPGVDTEQLLLKYPGGSANVNFFIIGHLGGNTGGVYELSGWNPVGIITPDGSSGATVTVKAWDHQGDVNGVWADTTVLTGGITAFNPTPDPLVWTADIYNTAGAPVGVYPIPAMASSPASPTYQTYNWFTLEVKDIGDAKVKTVNMFQKPTEDTWFDVGVQPGGFVYVVADHPATGNVGGDAVTGTRTCIQFDNKLTTMVVLNPGTGMAQSDSWDFDPLFDWDRVDASVEGYLITDTGGGGIGTWAVTGDMAASIACCWMFTCSPNPAAMADVTDHQALGFAPGLIGFGRTSLLCSPVANWALAFSDNDMANYSGYNFTPDHLYDPIQSVVGMDGIDDTLDLILLINDGVNDRLSVFSDGYAMTGTAGELMTIGSFGMADGQFYGGLDVAMDSANNILTLEKHAAGVHRFQKFDANYNWVYSSIWVDSGEPLRIDFDEDDNMLYCVSTVGVHEMSVD